MPSPHYKRITWKRVFAEGEKRIQHYFLRAMVHASTSRERNSLLARREGVRKAIEEIILRPTPIKLKRVLKQQMYLLMEIIEWAMRPRNNR
jgi:hypothetical protein